MSGNISKSPIIKLTRFINKEIHIEIIGEKRQVSGFLKAFDKYNNIILQDSTETIKTQFGPVIRQHSLMYVRGDVVTSYLIYATLNI